jgi:hypothetical protein
MRKIVSPGLALLLILAVVPLAQAFDLCSPANPGSVEVTLRLEPEPTQVCPGEKLTVIATIANTGDCHDFFLVTVGMYHYEPTFDAWWSEFPGRARCKPLLPMLMVPLTAGGSFDFNYSGIIPEILPPGEYGLLLRARGTRGGATDKASTTFTVSDCTGVCSDNSQCGPGEYCKKPMGECNGPGVCSPQPDVCFQVWAPVCGCDGRTHTNEACAAVAGVNVAYEGVCVP